ncbi:hypothetical protein H696_02367 [Fonticula alba]|uniref:Cleavage/polyadenylation specificity factor A subunit C-terminal domain-containing protein n=1 Tax=Fonticula alba TaxID=691883 RepID=A0A058ZAK0_FONAL|nr:hypothetical protein H696_02367 [Fonticula alba]KCV71420.1 hypothetical protein H696_02367 [Fonticula alba]|eukprot:XP_009494543.1 hypothetical protein H696_02367 [Fonticula alba]
MSNLVYPVHDELSPPTAVESSIICNLLSPDESCLVVLRSSLLQVFRVLDRRTGTPVSSATLPKDGKLCLAFSHRLWGDVMSIRAVRLDPYPTDVLIVASLEAKLSLVVFDPYSQSMETLSMHHYEDESLKEGRVTFNSDPELTVDPANRCASLRVYDDHFAILPLGQTGMMDLDGDAAKDRSLLTGSSFVLDCSDIDNGFRNVKTSVFLHGYYQPTVTVLYEPVPTSPSLLGLRKDTHSIITFSLDLARGDSQVLWRRASIPFDAFQLIALPRPIGGVLVICHSSLIYVSHESLNYGVALNEFAKLSDYRFATNWASIGIGQISLDGSKWSLLSPSRLLASLRNGDLYMVDILAEGSFVNRISFERLASAGLPSGISPIGSTGFVFLSSQLGLPLLLHMEEKGRAVLPVTSAESPAPALSSTQASEGFDELDLLFGHTEGASTAGGAADLKPASASSGWLITVSDWLHNIGPIKDFAVGRAVGVSNAISNNALYDFVDIVALSGHDSTTTFSIMQRGIRPRILSSFDMEAQDIFNIRSSSGPDAQDAFLILSFAVSRSLILQCGEGLTELTDTGLVGSEATIHAEPIEGTGCFIQVTPSTLRILSMHDASLVASLALSARAPDASAVSASMAGPLLAILFSDGSLQALQFQPEQQHFHPVDLSAVSLLGGDNAQRVTALAAFHDRGHFLRPLATFLSPAALGQLCSRVTPAGSTGAGAPTASMSDLGTPSLASVDLDDEDDFLYGGSTAGGGGAAEAQAMEVDGPSESGFGASGGAGPLLGGDGAQTPLQEALRALVSPDGAEQFLFLALASGHLLVLRLPAAAHSGLAPAMAEVVLLSDGLADATGVLADRPGLEHLLSDAAPLTDVVEELLLLPLGADSPEVVAATSTAAPVAGSRPIASLFLMAGHRSGDVTAWRLSDAGLGCAFDAMHGVNLGLEQGDTNDAMGLAAAARRTLGRLGGRFARVDLAGAIFRPMSVDLATASTGALLADAGEARAAQAAANLEAKHIQYCGVRAQILAQAAAAQAAAQASSGHRRMRGPPPSAVANISPHLQYQQQLLRTAEDTALRALHQIQERFRHSTAYSSMPDTAAQMAQAVARLRHRPRRLRAFTHVGASSPLGFEGVFVCGARPKWIVYSPRTGFCVHSMHDDGPVRAFTPLSIQSSPRGVAYLAEAVSHTAHGRPTCRLRVSQLPKDMKIDSPWPIRRVPLRCRAHKIAYHPESGHYIVATSQLDTSADVATSGIDCEDQQAGGPLQASTVTSDLEAATHATPMSNGALPIPPDRRRFSIELWSPSAWLAGPADRIEPMPSFAQMREDGDASGVASEKNAARLRVDEQVLAVETVYLDTTGAGVGTDVPTERRPFIAVGTGTLRGADESCGGRILIFDVVERHHSDPKKATSSHRLKLVFSKTFRTPVSAVTELGGHIALALGQRIILYSFKDAADLVGRAFLDVHTYVTALSSVAGRYLLVGDALRGVCFARYKGHPLVGLDIIGSDRGEVRRHSPVGSGEFIVDDTSLAMVSLDDAGSMHVLRYDPASIQSIAGKRLLRTADMHVGANQLSCPRSFRFSMRSPSVRSSRQQFTLFASSEGVLSSVAPVPERRFHRLSLLQRKLTSGPTLAALSSSEYGAATSAQVVLPSTAAAAAAAAATDLSPAVEALRDLLSAPVLPAAALRPLGSLNPRAFRVPRAIGPHRSAGAGPGAGSGRRRGVVDIVLIRHAFLNSSMREQREIARRIGSSVEQLFDDLLFLEHSLDIF